MRHWKLYPKPFQSPPPLHKIIRSPKSVSETARNEASNDDSSRRAPKCCRHYNFHLKAFASTSSAVLLLCFHIVERNVFYLFFYSPHALQCEARIKSFFLSFVFRSEHRQQGGKTSSFCLVILSGIDV